LLVQNKRGHGNGHEYLPEFSDCAFIYFLLNINGALSLFCDLTPC